MLAAKGSRLSTFTYYASTVIKIGSLVEISLGNRRSLGVVKKSTSKPNFKTKPVESVLGLKPLPQSQLKLADWLSEYYAAPLGRVWQSILPHASLKVKTATPPAAKIPPKPAPLKLTASQTQAIAQITGGKAQNYLLFGATGSGKTQVYIELTKSAFKTGHSVIMLVPEISLTPQITGTFTANFGSQVLLTHSGLTAAKRRDVWRQSLNSKVPVVVIGPRSALFTPVPNPAYIIIDESHDSSYKQDQAPRYSTQAAAAQLAKLTKAKLVMGTATPPVADMFLAKNHRLKLVKMPKPIFVADSKPPVVIDLKDKNNLKHSYLLSEPLIEILTQTLGRNKQSLLFLNRRGSARLVLCNDCGWNAICPDCQIPLTWHADNGRLVCHWCNYSSQVPASCPDCSSLNIRYIGSGTKHLEAEVAKLFPAARLERLDRDSFNPKTIPKLYRQLAKGHVDILLGTQMITKGLDLPGVETVGVVLADNALYVPDFSAAERAFQLLYQVSGRAGRRQGGIRNSIIQTYSPLHPAIIAAAKRDYEGFYKYELAERRAQAYPPYVYLAKLWITKNTRAQAAKNAQDLTAKIRNNSAGSVDVVGPAPAWQETQGGRYSWQIILKSTRRQPLIKVVSNLPQDWSYDIDPIDLL